MGQFGWDTQIKRGQQTIAVLGVGILLLGRPASAQTEPLPLPAIEDPVLSGEETGEPEPSDLGVDPAIDQTEAMDPDTPASSPSATGVGLPTGEIVTPPLPPALVVPSGSEDSPPVGIPHLPGSAAELQAPQDPLQVRIEARQGLELEEALAIAVERTRMSGWPSWGSSGLRWMLTAPRLILPPLCPVVDGWLIHKHLI
ncbi:MAG: hypothetical protein HC924_15650 [Synechococcaceae cyanobacterium SM2_3_2]|nr:hypothetical protein [Synechococcaceae cyanobacterium SM2_3_2]